MINDPAVVVSDDGSATKTGITFAPVNLEFAYPGSEARKDQRNWSFWLWTTRALVWTRPQTGRPANELKAITEMSVFLFSTSLSVACRTITGCRSSR